MNKRQNRGLLCTTVSILEKFFNRHLLRLLPYRNGCLCKWGHGMERCHSHQVYHKRDFRTGGHPPFHARWFSKPAFRKLWRKDRLWYHPQKLSQDTGLIKLLFIILAQWRHWVSKRRGFELSSNPRPMILLYSLKYNISSSYLAEGKKFCRWTRSYISFSRL